MTDHSNGQPPGFRAGATLRLPSGKSAAVRERPATGRDLIRAQRAVPRGDDVALGFALLAELVQIDGAPVTWEQVSDLTLEDIATLGEAAGLGQTSFLSPARSTSPDSSPSDSR